MQTNNKMAVAPVGKLIWQMSIPPLISMFLQYSYNLIDSAFVARLSENALTAVSLSFPITTLMLSLIHILDEDLTTPVIVVKQNSSDMKTIIQHFFDVSGVAEIQKEVVSGNIPVKYL